MRSGQGSLLSQYQERILLSCVRKLVDHPSENEEKVLLKTVKEELKDEKTEELTKQLEELEIKEKIPEARKEQKYTASETLWTSKVINPNT